MVQIWRHTEHEPVKTYILGVERFSISPFYSYPCIHVVLLCKYKTFLTTNQYNTVLLVRDARIFTHGFKFPGM
jgi:hypothetical protein